MKIDWRWEVPQLLMLGLLFAVSLWAWGLAPDRVPIHWNLQGEADGFAGKTFGLFFGPAMAAGLYLLLLFLPRIDPGRDNIANSARPLRAIRLSLTTMLTVLHLVCVRAALGGTVNMTLVVCLLTGALFVVLGNYLGKLRPNWFAGVRTPWTLSSQLSWTKTHRAAGPVLMGMGAGMFALAFVPTGWMLGIVLSLDVLAVVGLVVYSYLVWRDDPDRIAPAGVSAAPDRIAEAETPRGE